MKLTLHMKRVLPLLGALCLGAAPLQAQSGTESQPRAKVMKPETQGSNYEQGSFSMITPPAGPAVNFGADLFLTADFLYWGVKQSGTSFAQDGLRLGEVAENAFENSVQASSGQQKDIGSDWSPGFKVGLGINLEHDGWDIRSEYSWLRPSHDETFTSSNGIAPVYGLFGVAGALPQGALIGSATAGDEDLNVIEKVKSKWDLDYNLVDLNVGRNFYLSQFLTMRPFIGARGTWQSQCWNTTYTNSGKFQLVSKSDPDEPVLADVENPYSSKQKVDVWGLGVNAGINLAFLLNQEWSLYGDLGFSSLWVDYDVSRKDELTVTQTIGETTESNTPVTLVDQKSSYYGIKYVTDMGAGIRYQTRFCDDSYAFLVQAGWNAQKWINWTQFIDLNGVEWHDLDLHGLDLRFRFDF